MQNFIKKNITRNFVPGLTNLLESCDQLPDNKKEVPLKEISRLLREFSYPAFENDSTVILFYNGAAENVSMLSDLTGWTDPIEFKKLKHDFFYLRLEIETDARIQYLLIVDGNPICDPLNKFKALHGLGAMSELAMPGYERHPYIKEFIYGKEGSFEGLIKHVLPPGALPYEHEINVYLPPGYSAGEKYPSVYFHDGPDYIRFGLAPCFLNRLISEDIIHPCIAVFITPPNLHQPAVPNRSTEYGMNDDYVKFVCDEAVPFIDQNYSTDKSAESRLIIGDSYAGLISFYIALCKSDIFRNAYSQSGYFSFNNDRLIKFISEKEKLPLKLYFDAGTYEEKVGADFLPKDELDFTSANRRMKDTLTKKGYDFIYKEYHEGHTWGSWRSHLIKALIHFFGKKENGQ